MAHVHTDIWSTLVTASFVGSRGQVEINMGAVTDDGGYISLTIDEATALRDQLAGLLTQASIQRDAKAADGVTA